MTLSLDVFPPLVLQCTLHVENYLVNSMNSHGLVLRKTFVLLLLSVLWVL